MAIRMQQTQLPHSPTDVLGVPTGAPQFESFRGPGGQLKKEFTMTARPELAGAFAKRLRGTGDIERLRGAATAEGLTPGQALARQRLQQGAVEGGQAAAARGVARLAMRGGVGAGARERLAGQAMQQQQRGIQDIGMQTEMASEAEKARLRETLPGMQLGQEQAILGAQQADVGRQERAQAANILTRAKDVSRKGTFESDRFQKQMEAIAAERQARAEESGKK